MKLPALVPITLAQRQTTTRPPSAAWRVIRAGRIRPPKGSLLTLLMPPSHWLLVVGVARGPIEVYFTSLQGSN